MRARTGGSGTTTGYFTPQTIARLFPGTAEMSVVVVAKLRSAAVVAAIDVFEYNIAPFVGPIRPLGGWGVGFDRNYPEFYNEAVDATGVIHFGEGRPWTALDVNKVHRCVGVSSVANNLMRCYVNGRRGNVDDVLPSFLPMASPTPSVIGVLGATQTGPVDSNGMTEMEVLDLAVVDRYFSADEVATLDRLILATGGIPPGFAQWVEFYQAERLINHPLVIDAGGMNAGRGWPEAGGAAPLLSSVLITPDIWGGTGV
jgi:hypothetical protein